MQSWIKSCPENFCYRDIVETIGAIWIWSTYRIIMFYLFPLTTDFIVWIFATIILYSNFNFLQKSIFHIARSLHFPFYAKFPSRTISPNPSLQIVWFGGGVHLLNCVRLFLMPRTIACLVLLSMRFPRQEYWSYISI